jgi:Ca-activated chloride channel family protein
VTPAHLAHPEWAAPVASAVAIVAAVAVISFAVARRRARRLLGSPQWVPRAQLLRDLSLVAAFAAAGAALLGPTAGMRTLTVAGSGVDLVLLFDVSRSMDAADVPPSRLARARALAASVLARLGPEDRVALAAFAGRGVLLTPLTPDFSALDEMLASLDSGLIQPGGSDLGAGVVAASSAFEAASERPRVVLALADGEDPVAQGDIGASAAQRAGVRVVGVALGSDAGAAIPDGGSPLQDARGRPVLSRRDATRLAALAAATGGASFAGDRWGDVDETALLAALRRDAAKTRGGTVERRVPATQVAPLAALAFALLLFELAGGARPLLVWLRARRSGVAAALLIALTLGVASLAADSDSIASLEAQLRERPGDPALLIALGVARAERGRHDEAALALRAAAIGASDADDAAVAHYDLGVLEAQRRRFGAARDAFLDALALAPDDTQARFNLEWSLRALTQMPAPPEQRRAADDDAAESAERPDPKQPDPTEPPGARPGGTPESQRPSAERGDEKARGFAPELSPDRAQQWLDAVADDPGRALRSAARGADGEVAPRAELSRW